MGLPNDGNPDTLYANGAASYSWGSLLLEVSSSATADGNMIMRILADLIVGAFSWERPRDVRTAIAIQHEIIHLQQDLTTGMGAWDHVTTRTAYSQLIDGTRMIISRFDESPYKAAQHPLFPKPDGAWGNSMHEALGDIRDRTIASRQISGAPWNSPAARRVLQDWLKMTPETISQLDVSLRTILEGEAAVFVERMIRGSSGSERSKSELEACRNLWSVPAMTDVYNAAFSNVVFVVANGIPNRDALGHMYDPMLMYTSWLLDLVQSYPPPQMLATFGDEIAAFDPVVRYVMLLRATNEIAEEPFGELLHAVSEYDFKTAERLLLSSCAFNYPTSQEIYSAWLEVLGPISEEDSWDAPLFQLRKDAIESRLENQAVKGVSAVIDSRVPVQMLIRGVGIKGLVVGPQNLEEIQGPLFKAMMCNRLDRDLYRLFYDGGRFRCIMGLANICDGATESCRSGLMTMADLPAKDVCSVRINLHEIGYAI